MTLPQCRLYSEAQERLKAAESANTLNLFRAAIAGALSAEGARACRELSHKLEAAAHGTQES